MTDDNNKPNAKTQSIPSSVNPDAAPVNDMSQERSGKTIWLYGESMMNDPPGNRIAFDSKEAADTHARQRAEEYVEEQGEDPPKKIEYEAWFGYATNARSFQVWPIPYRQTEDSPMMDETL